jgi:hypothetical protein
MLSAVHSTTQYSTLQSTACGHPECWELVGATGGMLRPAARRLLRLSPPAWRAQDVHAEQPVVLLLHHRTCGCASAAVACSCCDVCQSSQLRLTWWRLLLRPSFTDPAHVLCDMGRSTHPIRRLWALAVLLSCYLCCWCCCLHQRALRGMWHNCVTVIIADGSLALCVRCSTAS